MIGRRPAFHGKRVYRWLSALFGSIVVATGIYSLCFVEGGDWAAWVVGVAFVAAGGNLVWSALRGTESWLSRIGSLP